MSEVTEPVLRVVGLGIETLAGVEIVRDVSFEVEAATVLALVGESGCGKTSVAMALLGHARPGTRISAGSVVLDGTDLLALTQRSLRQLRGSTIAYVPQDPTSGLNPRHRVGDQIAETLEVHGMPARDAQREAQALAQRLRLPAGPSFLRRFPFELSGGQQQRVAIGMALVSRPLVIVLDEPTTGLDVTTQSRVLALLGELGREYGTAFVYVTHDLAVADTLAHQVAVLYAGRIVEAGPRNAVLRRPAHPYSAMLLGSVPHLRVRRELVGIPGTAPAPGSRPTGCLFVPRCPLAIDRCREDFPAHTTVGAGHVVRCWRAGELPVSEAVHASARHLRSGVEPTLLTVHDLVASYGRRSQVNTVVRGVSFQIDHGECLALVGESGSGKTTIGRCVAGLHAPDRGSIVLDGEPLAARTAGRSQAQVQSIQIVFQNPDRSLNPAETTGSAIARPLRLFGFPSAARDVIDLLERVRLPATYVDRYPRELSGGEKQRVAIARALAARPRLLVCDEITSALDVSIQAAIIRLLEELRREGLALLFITHNLALVNSIADNVIVLEAGEIRERGSADAVIRDPAHAYTRELLAAAPELQ